MSDKLKNNTESENIKEDENKKEYKEYVDKVTPRISICKNVFNAFWIGGLICVMGQIWIEIFTYAGMDEKSAATWTTVVLILESVILTGLNIYPKIGKVGGAGALVPITGFANSVAAPAIEFKVEGEVFGKGTRIFIIAGPVILYGILSSFLAGIMYWIGTTYLV